MRILRSVRAQFTGWYLIVLAVLLALLSVGLYTFVSYTLRRNLDDGLIHRTEQLAGTRGLLQVVEEGRFEEALGELVAFYRSADDRYEVTATRALEPMIDEAWVDAALAGIPVFATVAADDGQVFRFHIRRLPPPASVPPPEDRPAPPRDAPREGEPPATVLVVGRPMDIVLSPLSALRATLLIAIPLTLLLSAGGGLFLARRALHPVDRMIETARDIEESDLAKRVDVATDDELGRLARTLNAMLERLEGAFRRQRQFTDDASHELRSPLSVIEAEATLALRRERTADDYRDALATIADEAAGMNRLIDQLLTLARADAGEDRAVREPVDLSEVARETIEAIRPVADERGVGMHVEDCAPVSVIGDSVRLKRLAVNLIDNAIRYTPSGGSVTASVVTEGETVLLTVADTGIGIAPEHLPHVFERFYRADAARQRGQGSGLGLSICRQIVEEHGGTIDVESAEGEGTRFLVRLPVT